MKNKELNWAITTIFLFWGNLQMLAFTDYGLYFKSHSVSGTERTVLSLDKGSPFHIKNEFVIDFQMQIRNGAVFGGILHLCSENQCLHFVFAAGDNNRYFPAFVFNEGLFGINANIEKGKWIPISLRLDIKKNQIDLKYDDKDTTMVVPLFGTKDITVSFGKSSHFSADVVPMNVKNIKISRDGELIRYWNLGRHNGDVCLDEIEGAVALASNPIWLIDNHIEWQKIYTEKTSDRLDIAFDARKCLFYLVRQNRIQVLNGVSGDQNEVPIVSGYPAMEYAGHMVYDTLGNQLLSYSLHEKLVSALSANVGKWDLNERHSDESHYYNHARAFNPSDSSFYFWGGYGFYRYRNNLYRLKVDRKQIEEVPYTPTISPRYSSAAAIVGNELYIFGGRGNKQGRQEFNASFNYELCAINLKTGKSRSIWKKKQPVDMLLMASTMYFEPSDSSFYAVSMKDGGTLLKVFMNDSILAEVSRPIHDDLVYQDCDYSFYSSPAHQKLYLVVNKILNDHTHDIVIYSINTPLLNDNEIMQDIEEHSNSVWFIPAICISLLGGVAFLLYRMKHGKKKAHSEDISRDHVQQEISVAAEGTENVAVEEKYFNRDRAAISLLGTFNVRDKDGKDITDSFSPRLKSLLILLILHSEKNERGILAKKATDMLWPDQEEEAARNNRNVTLRKLRVLLAKVGDVKIVSDMKFLRIQWGEDIFCDYSTVLKCIRQFKENGEHDERLLNQILEILLYGPLLSNTIVDWLDEFKDSYSSLSIDLLRSLLDMQRDNHDTILRIADILFLHDPLNEEALAAKCSTLFAQGKKGIAKSVYERFCKEYKDSLGVEYKIPLSNYIENAL